MEKSLKRRGKIIVLSLFINIFDLLRFVIYIGEYRYVIRVFFFSEKGN